MKILVINGPNINMLGIREPGIYGKKTFQDLLRLLNDTAQTLNIEVEQYQSNHEGDLVDKIQWAYGRIDGIVINPAAYTHTSALPICLDKLIKTFNNFSRDIFFIVKIEVSVVYIFFQVICKEKHRFFQHCKFHTYRRIVGYKNICIRDYFVYVVIFCCINHVFQPGFFVHLWM